MAVQAIAETPSEAPPERGRIPAFDFTKGVLVLFMVLYHWLNYFYGPYGAVYKYLRFLTPSFIFITGFLISHAHFAKYGVGSGKLAKRLAVRGIKLLLVFFALNALASLFVPTSFERDFASSRAILPDLNWIFVVGDTSGGDSGKIAAFTILVPIAYLLVVSSLLSLTCRVFKYAFHVACGLSLLGMIVLDISGIPRTNVELVTIGLLGVVLGYASQRDVQRVASRPGAIIAAYAIYLTAITVWNVSLYVQMVGACLTTMLIYTIGLKEHASTTWLHAAVVLLGKYSLFGYIAQIAILKTLHAGLSRAGNGFAVLAGSLIAGCVLTVLAVEATDRWRAHSKAIDAAYRLVFA